MDISLYNMIYLFFGLLLSSTCILSKEPGCCSGIQDRKCRRLCEQVHAQSLPIPQLQMLLTYDDGCPPSMTDFWDCIQDSLEAVQLMSSWPGKTCCELGRKECRRKCFAAESKIEMQRYCRESEEERLFTCVREQDAASMCCDDAKSPSCGIVCRGVYLTGVSDARALLADHCVQEDNHVADCVLQNRQPNHSANLQKLPCCDFAETEPCGDTCRRVLQVAMTDDDRMNALIDSCGFPKLGDKFWMCFISEEPKVGSTELSVTRVDNAKLLCCEKATTQHCRELCANRYKKSWSYQAEFDTSCSDLQGISPVEVSMHNCLTDVDQPCHVGCSGLSFCRNFNHRPSELFRSCTREADKAARRVFQSWMNGIIHLPHMHMDIAVKNIRYCRPAMWKAVACALEVKPCTATSSLINICREDCITLLSECMDSSRLHGGETVAALCNTLHSKTVPGACVSIEKYLFESPFTSSEGQVTNPCNPSPCASDEVCRVKRRQCKNPDHCQAHVCVKACQLGQPSNVWVPRGSKVKLPDLSMESDGFEDCHVSYHCNSRGKLDNQKPLSCMRRDYCTIRHGDIKEHGEHFWGDRGPSVCNYGKIIHARNACKPDNNSPQYATQPAHCPDNYEPVCGINGKTYPNRCLAQCDGVSRFLAYMPCNEMDSCSQKPCPSDHRCVPRPQVCLNTRLDEYCPQFECVSEGGDCAPHRHDPACSSSGEEYTNMCMLFSNMKLLGYRGHCQMGCSSSGVVCGYDGETYSSECAAKAARVTVDYFGKCLAFGNLTESSLNMSVSCNRVQCPPLQPSNCIGITPPGACCPLCASQMILHWDQRQMNSAANHFRNKIISTQDVLKKLSEQVAVQECDVYGYLGVSGEMVVLVAAVVPQPSAIQVQACQAEAKRLHSLITSGSPVLTSHLVLSPLVLSSLQQSSVSVSVSVNKGFVSDSYSTQRGADNNAGAWLDRDSASQAVCNTVLLSVIMSYSMLTLLGIL